MWPELYINSKLVSLAPSVRHHHRHLHYHRYYYYYYYYDYYDYYYYHHYYYYYYYYYHTKRAAPASATWNHLHAAGRTNPLSPGHPLPPRSPPLFALQPGGRRKLLEFSKSDVQDIMNEGMASSRRWRRWWSSNRGCLQRAGGGRGESGERDLGGWAEGCGGTQAKLPASAHSSASRTTHQPIRLA